MLKQSVIIASLIFLGCNPSGSNVPSTDSSISDSNLLPYAQQPEQKPVQQNIVTSKQAAIFPDSSELIRFWDECVEPVISLNAQKIKEIVHFPLEGDWGYMIGLGNPKSNWTESDFYNGLDKLFYKEFRDSLDHQTYKDVHVYQQDDGEINLMVQVNFVRYADDFKHEKSRILRYKKINDRWMLYVILEAG